MRPLPPATNFGDMLRRTLVCEKLLPLSDVAAALRMTERGFRSKMQGGGRFDPDQVVALLRLIADERLLWWFFSGSDLMLLKLPSTPPDHNRTLRASTAACAAEALVAIEALADALDLSVEGERRKIALVGHLDRAQHGLSSINLHLAPSLTDQHVTTNADPHEDFPHLVHRVLRVDQGISPQALANALNLRYPALHERMSGRVAFLPIELRALLRTFPDTRLADYLLAGTAYTAIRRPGAVEVHNGESPTRLGLQSLREVTKFLALMLLTGDIADSSMHATAKRHLGKAVGLLATMRWQMTHIGHLAT
jgi:hypothetical protein